jgi:hypothetical protein
MFISPATWWRTCCDGGHCSRYGMLISLLEIIFIGGAAELCKLWNRYLYRLHYGSFMAPTCGWFAVPRLQDLMLWVELY